MIVGAVSLFFTTPSDAGYANTFYICEDYVTFARCGGGLRAWRYNQSEGDYAGFGRTIYGDNFYARFGGRTYSCYLPSTATPETRRVWDAMLAGEAFFWIDWNPTIGKCDFLQLWNSSEVR